MKTFKRFWRHDVLYINEDITKSQLESIALESPIAKKWMDGKTAKKIIVIQGKLVNIVI